MIRKTAPDPASFSTLIGTKFGGSNPWVDPKEPWPHCPACDCPKDFLFQVNLSQLPSEYQHLLGRSRGLLQVFICDDLCSGPEGIRLVEDEKLWMSLESLAVRKAARENVDVGGLPKELREQVLHARDQRDYANHKTELEMREVFVDRWEVLGMEMPDTCELALPNCTESELDELLDVYEDAFEEEDEEKLDYIHPRVNVTDTAKLGNDDF